MKNNPYLYVQIHNCSCAFNVDVRIVLAIVIKHIPK